MKPPLRPPQPVAPTTVPDTNTLAMLAAQARFAALPPDEAVRQASILWQKADNWVENAKIRRQQIAEYQTGQQLIPKTTEFPASLDDFYRRIVQGKDSATNQERFRKAWLSKYRISVAGRPPPTPEQELDDWEKAIQNFKRDGFTKEQWNDSARIYLDWWAEQKTEKKRKGGRARAAKADARKRASTVPKPS